MAANAANIDLVTPSDNKSNPSCSHGPTLLFERFDPAVKMSRQFYACSAFRDRKSCNFFQWVDEKSGAASSEYSTRLQNARSQISHRELQKRYFHFKKLPRNERYVCCTCGLLLLDKEELSCHKNQEHTVKCRIGLKDLKQPTFLFRPLDNNKTYAQYLFSKSMVNFLLDNLTDLCFSHVLCVGTPRIHEEIQLRKKNGKTTLSSMLLDLDDRYAQLYPPALFAKYNMFNHHFFETQHKTKLRRFFTEGNGHLVLITDPPFGGMVEALANTFRKLSSMWKKAIQMENDGEDCLIPILWFFPYFLENRIIAQLPEVTMLDYKVDYDNHSLFNNKQKKKGSPVRIFTNIDPASFILPAEEGYWFCKQCKRFSSKENWHCKDCGACTSKDGTTYVHCDACMRCVKPSRVHCYTCQMCQLKDHTCGRSQSSGCHICGEQDHKRRNCPQKGQMSTDSGSRGIKRKLRFSKGTKYKRKKGQATHE